MDTYQLQTVDTKHFLKLILEMLPARYLLEKEWRGDKGPVRDNVQSCPTQRESQLYHNVAKLSVCEAAAATGD